LYKKQSKRPFVGLERLCLTKILTVNLCECLIYLQKIIALCLPVAWFLIIFIMSNKPSWLKIDISSGRVANYLSLPLIVLSPLGIYYLLEKSKQKLPQIIVISLFLMTIGTGFISGLISCAIV